MYVNSASGRRLAAGRLAGGYTQETAANFALSSGGVLSTGAGSPTAAGTFFPLITLTDLAIPGMGTYTARVILYRDQYAGTWSGKDHGGQIFGIASLSQMRKWQLGLRLQF